VNERDFAGEIADNRDSPVETVLNSAENNIKEIEDNITENKDSLQSKSISRSNSDTHSESNS